MKPRVLAFQKRLGMENEALSHMIAASMGEAVACLVRVPTEGAWCSVVAVGMMVSLNVHFTY